VRERAKKYTQEDKDAMLEDLSDVATSTIVAHMQGEECPPSRLRAAINMLNTISRYRNNNKPAPPKVDQVYKSGKNILHF
jgi:hypothetical protein